MKWINVDVGVPNDGQLILVTDGRLVVLGVYKDDSSSPIRCENSELSSGFVDIRCYECDDDLGPIIFWMPLILPKDKDVVL
jgi:hypothetical protein